MYLVAGPSRRVLGHTQCTGSVDLFSSFSGFVLYFTYNGLLKFLLYIECLSCCASVNVREDFPGVPGGPSTPGTPGTPGTPRMPLVPGQPEGPCGSWH